MSRSRIVQRTCLAVGLILIAGSLGAAYELFLAPPPATISRVDAVHRASGQWPVAVQPGLEVRNPALVRDGWGWEWRVEVFPPFTVMSTLSPSETIRYEYLDIHTGKVLHKLSR
jgi:hypothetical protein